MLSWICGQRKVMQAADYADMNALLMEMVNEIERREILWEADAVSMSRCPCANSSL
jgi:hypothetical protein